MVRCLFTMLLVFFAPSFAHAIGDRLQVDGSVIITMLGGKPCFSYPRDNEILDKEKKGTPYKLESMAISPVGRNDGSIKGFWEIFPDKPNVSEPDSLKKCIKFGILTPGMKTSRDMESLVTNQPYKVKIYLYLSNVNIEAERVYRSDFCLIRNSQNKTIVVAADWDDRLRDMKCLKLGEQPVPPKRTFWQKLFGK